MRISKASFSRIAVIFVFSAMSIPVAIATDRMPPVPQTQYDDAQKKAADDFLATRKVPVFGPFAVLIRSPELMTANRIFGDYLRFKSSIGNKLSELVILIVAREWTQDYEWYLHAPIAVKQGISKDVVDAIAEGRRPTGMSEDMETIYDLSTELLRHKRVSDVTYAHAVKLFGERGVLDIAGIAGYYTELAMVMNTSQMAIPADGKPLMRLPPTN